MFKQHLRISLLSIAIEPDLGDEGTDNANLRFPLISASNSTPRRVQVYSIGFEKQRTDNIRNESVRVIVMMPYTSATHPVITMRNFRIHGAEWDVTHFNGPNHKIDGIAFVLCRCDIVCQFR